MPDPAEGNIFNDEPAQDQPVKTQAPAQDDKYATLLMSIKNENGEQKYNSIEKALEALGHSQAFIPQLKSQLAEKEEQLKKLTGELDQRESVEEVVQRLIASKTKEEDNHPAIQGLDEQAVTSLVQRTLQQTRQAEEIKLNQQKVQDALKSKFGDKAGDAVAQKAAELGTTPKELGELASKNPNLVLALFNQQGSKDPSITTSSVNLPLNPKKPDELKRPEKSILSGATTKDQKEFLSKVKAAIYAKHGIDS